MNIRRSQSRACVGYIGISEQALVTTLDQVASDPYTQFIVKVWH